MNEVRGVSRATLTTQLEEAIRTDIIAGALAPNQRLRATELTERYGVSATPLREALQRLAAQNLIEIDPRIGAKVAPISRAHLHDTYLMRELLETRALERSVERGGAEWEQQVRDKFDEFRRAVEETQDDEGAGAASWSLAHRAFHEALLAACDSPWLTSLLNTLNDHTERYRILSVRTGARNPIKEHEAIFDHATARDVAGAVGYLREHLERTVELVEQSVAAAEGQD